MTVTVEKGARATGKHQHPGPRSPRPRNSYALFLVPGALAALAVIVVPFLMNTAVSFTSWQGVGDPKWTGLANYRDLLDDAEFWASFRHSLFMVVAMAAVPTIVGLVLAAALFDYIAKHFGTRIAASSAPASTSPRCSRSRSPASSGAGSSPPTTAPSTPC
jgi:raffinose/stachyose/melibiose transport system permease protein